MKYICEIDVAYVEGAANPEESCGRECVYHEKKNKSRGAYPYCNLFRKRLRLDRMPYELPAVIRCDECRRAFYPAPDEEGGGE